MIRLRQVCIAVPRIDAAEQLAEIFAVPICHRDPLVNAFGLENALLAFGPTFVEFVAPIAADTAATRFLARHPGGGGYMVILDTDELAAVRKRVDDAGIRIAHASDPARRREQARDPRFAAAAAAYAGFTNIQLHPRDVGGTLLEFNWTQGGEELFGAYAPAGLHWQGVAAGEHRPRILAAEITSPTPEAVARRWSQLMSKPARAQDEEWTIQLNVGEVRFTRGDTATFSRLRIGVADTQSVLERARAHNCEVRGSTFPFCGIQFALTSPAA